MRWSWLAVLVFLGGCEEKIDSDRLCDDYGQSAAGGAVTADLAGYAIPNLITNQQMVLAFPDTWGVSVTAGTAVSAVMPDDERDPDGVITPAVAIAKSTVNGRSAADVLQDEMNDLVGRSFGGYTITDVEMCMNVTSDSGGASVVAARGEDGAGNAKAFSFANAIAAGHDGEVLVLEMLQEDAHGVGGVELIAAVFQLFRDDDRAAVGTESPSWAGDAVQAIGTALASAGPAMYEFLDDHMDDDGFEWKDDD